MRIGNNTMFGRIFFALSASFIISAGACNLASAQDDDDIFEDEIIPRDTAPVIGVRITEDSWKVVAGRKEQGTLSKPAHNILEVVYFDAPRTFAKGVRRVRRAYYTKAIDESFGPLMKGDKLSAFRKVGGRPWPEQYCLYYLGRSHLGRGDAAKGDPAKARDYFQKLVKNIPNSRFIFEACMGIGDAWDLEGRYSEAAKAYKTAQDRFEKMAKQSGLTRELRRAVKKHGYTAELRQAQMLDAQKKWPFSKSAYDKLATSSRDYPEIQALARVGAVRALVSDKVYDVAIRKAQEMIKLGEREGQTQFLGGAYLALADCYFERAGDEATPDDLVIARWNYLRVATLYFKERDLLPKARYRAGRCSERLSKVSKGIDKQKGKEWARRQYRMVAEKFKDSPWAIEAKNRLGAMGKGG